MGRLAVTSRDMRLPPRCKSEIIPIITSATKLMYCLNSSVTSQYLTWLQRKKGAAGTCTGHDMSFPCRCNSVIIVIITNATKLMSWPKFQRYISIFDLVTEEKRRSGYLGHVAWKSRNMSFQPGCRSEIIAMITSATQPMSFPNSGIKSEYLTYLQMKKDASGTWAV